MRPSTYAALDRLFALPLGIVDRAVTGTPADAEALAEHLGVVVARTPPA